MMKKYVFLTFVLLFGLTSVAAQDKLTTTFGTDVISQYIWRGSDLGHVSLQPSLELFYKNISLSAFGNVPLSDTSDSRELDLTLNYNIGKLNIGITDYWSANGSDLKNRYLHYNAHSTNHIFEANVGYDFDIFSLQWYTNFAGDDGITDSGHRAYSSYLEAAAPFKLGGCEWVATLGVVPYNTSYYEASGFCINNISLHADHDIKITDTFNIPVFAEIIANPNTEHVYFVFGFTLKVF